MSISVRRIKAGSAPAPSPSASRCTPSGPAEPEVSRRLRQTSAGSTGTKVHSVARSVAVRSLSTRFT
eukprot:scaffold22740_cov66-Phaeocystis_antarctica.AAC.2